MNENLRSSRKRLLSNSVSSATNDDSINGGLLLSISNTSLTNGNKKSKADKSILVESKVADKRQKKAVSLTSTNRTRSNSNQSQNNSNILDEKSNASTTSTANISTSLTSDEPSFDLIVSHHCVGLSTKSKNNTKIISAKSDLQKRSTRLRKQSNKFDNYSVEIKNFGNYPNQLHQENEPSSDITVSTDTVNTKTENKDNLEQLETNSSFTIVESKIENSNLKENEEKLPLETIKADIEIKNEANIKENDKDIPKARKPKSPKKKLEIDQDKLSSNSTTSETINAVILKSSESITNKIITEKFEKKQVKTKSQQQSLNLSEINSSPIDSLPAMSSPILLSPLKSESSEINSPKKPKQNSKNKNTKPDKELLNDLTTTIATPLPTPSISNTNETKLLNHNDEIEPSSNPSAIGELLRICKTKLGLKPGKLYSNLENSKIETEIFGKNTNLIENQTENVEIKTEINNNPVSEIKNNEEIQSIPTKSNLSQPPSPNKKTKQSKTNLNTNSELIKTEKILPEPHLLDNNYKSKLNQNKNFSLNNNTSTISSNTQTNISSNNNNNNIKGKNQSLQKKLNESRSINYDEIKYTYEQLIKEIKINTDLKINEILNQTTREKLKLKNFYENQIQEVKQKQWCANFNCGKESFYYCCWNTSYCDEECQRLHWIHHLKTCRRINNTSPETSPSAQQKILSTSNNTSQEIIFKNKKLNNTNNLNKPSKKNLNSKKNISSSYSSPSSSSIETGHISLEEGTSMGSNSVLGVSGSSEPISMGDQIMLKKTKKSKKMLASNCDSSISKIMGFELFNSNLHESIN